MNEQEPSAEIHAIKSGELTRRDHSRFSIELEQLAKDAEILRLTYMKRHQVRSNIALSLGLISILIGASGFGWFFLMNSDLLRALGSIALAVVIPLFLNIWSSRTLRDYTRVYKQSFLPRLAQTLGGFTFHPKRGIGPTLLSKTGIVPSYSEYQSEDCFIGTYKNVKIIFTETRLLAKNKSRVFAGVFVVLEIPFDIFEGHTILTAHLELYQKWRQTRWAKFEDVQISSQSAESMRFKILSDQPQAAQKFVTEILLKEISEISELYDHAPMSIALFRKKFIFMMIPYARNLFEPSSIDLPIATRHHALQCKREIEQILQIIDVLELYQKI